MPKTVTADPVTNTVYVGECAYVSGSTSSRCRVLRVTSTGIAQAYAGGPYSTTASSGDGGPATGAVFHAVGDTETDASGALYVADRYALRRVDPVTHIVTRFAGTYQSCGVVKATVGAAAANIAMSPLFLARDPSSSDVALYDDCSGSLVHINQSGIITAVLALGTRPQTAIAFDGSGRAYFTYNYKLYRTDPSGTQTVIAGTGVSGDTGDGGPATAAQISSVAGVAVDQAGTIFLAEGTARVVRKIDAQGFISRVVATGGCCTVGDGGPASAANLQNPSALTTDGDNSLYIVDGGAGRVRFVRSDGGGASVVSANIISTFAGGPGAAAWGELNGGGNPSELCADNCDDDVSTATGEYDETVDDLSIPGRGLALDFSRTYGSASAQEAGRLGFGWTDSYNMRFTVDAFSNNVIITQENGAQLVFYPNGTGGFTAPARQLATLVSNADGTYTLTRMARTKYVFDANGRLIREQDLNGYVTSLAYDGAGRLSTVTEPAGRSLSFSYDTSNRISLVADSAGRQVGYGYDGNGNLSSVTDVRGKQWTYSYDVNHLLLSRTDPNGHVDFANTYDSSGRLASQKDGLSRATTWTYGPGITTTTSPAGHVIKDYYANGALWKRVSGYGTPEAATTSYGYDATTLGVTLTTDGNGHTWGATYNSAGAQLTATDPLAHKTTNTYDALNDLTSVTDPKGVKTTYTYDTAGNRLTESTPLVGSNPAQSQVTTYTYGDSAHPGDITAVQDPNGKTTTNTYNANGDLASVTDPLGNATTYGYDAVGRRTSTVSPRGNAAGADPADFTTTYAYDAAGDKLSESDPLGHTATSAYDDAGNLAASTDADNHTTSYVYDAADQQTEIHRPDGSILKSSYDDDGNLASQTDGATNTTSYSYDALGRQVSKLDPLNRMTAYGYDGAGNQTTITDALSRTTTKTYDSANRVTAIAYSDGVTPGGSFGYDADDQRTSMTDGTGSSSWTYDSLHRVTQYANGHGDALSYGYDLAGNKTRITYPGSHAVAYDYDDAGRMTGLTDWLSHTTTFGYDRDSNQTSATFPSSTGNVDTYTYDRAGGQSATRFAQGTTTVASLDYTRDAKGLLTHVDSTGLPGTASHTYSYTSLDQLAADNSDAYAYDAADNPTTLAGVGGASFDAANQLTSNAGGAFGYDALGERTSSTPTGGSATTYGYDQAGRLTSFTPPTGSAATYAYDGTGLRASKTVGTTTTRFLWDQTGSLPLMLHDGSASYVYGPDGSVVERISAGGTPTYYHHDYLGSTRALTDASGAVAATFTYSPYGTLQGSTGSQSTPFGFAGEYTDAESSLIYLRARLYDPTTAQFVSVDSAERMTRQAYTYGNDDPVDLGDPSGMEAMPLPGCGDGSAEAAYKAGKAALIAALGVAVERCIRSGKCKPMSYRHEFEDHHIVPRGVTARKNAHAHHSQEVLHSVEIGINDHRNRIVILTGLHKRLHRNSYYAGVDAMVTAGAEMGGQDGVAQALAAIKKLIAAANAAAAAGMPFSG